MKTCRKLVATALLLLIYLSWLRAGDAARNDTNVSVGTDPGKILVEEVIISGAGNGTRITANALVEDPTKIADGILSLLSKREIRRQRSQRTSSNSDQDTVESRATLVIPDDEDNLEKLKHAIAEYEPQRITSKKAKRKIAAGGSSGDSHDARGELTTEVAEPTTGLERTYHEVLRNISRKAPELVLKNAGVTLNPYLSQVTKSLKQIPEVTIRTVASDAPDKPRPDSNILYTLPYLNRKYPKKLYKKYSQLNRTVGSSAASSAAEAKFDEEIADSGEATTKEYSEVSTEKPKNGSPSESSLNIHSDRPKNRRQWNIEDTSTVLPFLPRSNSSNIHNVYNPTISSKQSFPGGLNVLHSPSKFDRVPRPFTASKPTDTANADTNVETSLTRSNSSPTAKPAARSSADVVPLVLPTDLFNPPPVRRYVPIKRANRFSQEGSFATIITEASPPAASPPIVSDKPNGGYIAPYNNHVITRTPPFASLPDYYPAITEKPGEKIAGTGSTAAESPPSQSTSASYILQRPKNPQESSYKEELLPVVATRDGAEKSDLKASPGIALYDKFANLYSINAPSVPHVPTARDYTDFKQPASSQQVSAFPYASFQPVSFEPVAPKPRPIVITKSVAPYFDGRLLVPQVAEKEPISDKDSEESVETKERSREDNADEAEEEVADEKSGGNYKTRINHGTYKIHEKPSEKEDDEEDDRYQQQRRDYGQQEAHPGRRANDGEDRKREDVRNEDEEDEEDAHETRRDKYVSSAESEERRSESEGNRDHSRQYNNRREYERDDPEEKQLEKQRYDRKKYDKEGQGDKYDYDVNFKKKLASNYKYLDGLRHNDYETGTKDKEYRDDYDRKSARDNNKYKKNQEDRRIDEEREDDAKDKEYRNRYDWKPALNKKHQKDREDRKRKEREDDDDSDDVAEDKLLARRAKFSPKQNRGKYEKKSDDDGLQVLPRKDPRRRGHKPEEYSETKPKQVRQKYHHQQRGKDDQDGDNKDHVHGETQEHAHKHEEHHDKKDDGGDHKYEKGEGGEHEEEHHGHDGEKGDKGYKVWHEHEKAEKGHHDKEHASKEYDEKEGKEKKHEEDGGFHEQHHHGEAGEKTAEFGEKGEHQKGHSTKGEHSIHKKDEYEKKTEFFDEFHEDGGSEKHGQHHHEHESKKGGHEKKGHHDAADHEGKYGKEEKFEKGGHHHEHKGHKVDDGHDHHYHHHDKHGKKEGHEHGKKWSFKKGESGGGHEKASGDDKHER